MGDIYELLYQQYINEFKLRRRAAIILSVASVVCAFLALVVRDEPMNGIIVMNGAYCFFLILPPPKDWKDRVKRMSRNYVYPTVNCMLALFVFAMNEFIWRWATMSCFAILLAVFASSIAPYLKSRKKHE